MPYLNTQGRERIDGGHTPINTGQLNYQITKLAIAYLRTNGLSYETISQVRAAMADASEEFYRRVVVPYEDRKIVENGDVYPIQMTGGPK